DVVEFVPNVIRAAPFFPEVNHGVLGDPRVRVTIDDGRNFLLVTTRAYDVVSVDTLDPKHAGNGNLYTREFYELSRRVLSPRGILGEWPAVPQGGQGQLERDPPPFPGVVPAPPPGAKPFKGLPPPPRPPRAPPDRPRPARGPLPQPRRSARPRRGARGDAVAV